MMMRPGTLGKAFSLVGVAVGILCIVYGVYTMHEARSASDIQSGVALFREGILAYGVGMVGIIGGLGVYDFLGWLHRR
jgi:hypothetical protein